MNIANMPRCLQRGAMFDLAKFLFRQSIASPFAKKDKKLIIVNKNIDDDYERRVKHIFLNCEFEPNQCDVVDFLRKYVDDLD